MNVRKNLSSEEKNSIYQALADGLDSKTIRSTFGVTNAQLMYYKKNYPNWTPPVKKVDERLKSQNSKGKNPIAQELMRSFDTLKKLKKKELSAESRMDGGGVNFPSSLEMPQKNEIPSLVKEDKIISSSEDIQDREDPVTKETTQGKYLVFIIDGVEVLVRTNTKRIVIEDDKILVFRK